MDKQQQLSINTKTYIEEYLKIRTKDGKIKPFILNPAQMLLYEALSKQQREQKPQRVIVLKARQMGFSTLAQGIIFKKTATGKNVKSGIITHIEEATSNLFAISKLFLNNLPKELTPKSLKSNSKELVFDTKEGEGLGGRIKCMTAGSKGIGRSDTFTNLHISEYAFFPGDKRAILSGLLQAVPNTKDSMVIIESTANGYDEFKRLWDDAVLSKNDFAPVFAPWFLDKSYQMPYDGFAFSKDEKQLKEEFSLSDTQLAWRRWCINNNCGGDERIFKQEYPSTPQEAFLTSGDCVFDKEKISFYIKSVKKPVLIGQFYYDEQQGKIKTFGFEKGGNKGVAIYKRSEKGRPYVIGADTAGEGSDFFTAQVIDNITGEQVAVLKQQYDEDLYARQLYCLGKYYNNALLGVEANFSTYPIKELDRLGYKNQYWRETEDVITKRLLKSYGFKTTSVTRPLMIAELKKVARENLELIKDYETLLEMLSFIKNSHGRPEAQNGCHDDLVMALCIAHYIRPQQRSFIIDEDFYTEEQTLKDFLRFGG